MKVTMKEAGTALDAFVNTILQKPNKKNHERTDHRRY